MARTLNVVQALGGKVAAQADRSQDAWNRRASFLRMTCEGVLFSRWNTWCPSKGLSMKLDRLQRRLWSAAAGIRRHDGEEYVQWLRRRGVAASKLITKPWGTLQPVRSIAWHDHVRRAHACSSRASRV